MHKIDTTGSSGGLFVDPSPGSGIQGTVVDASYMNDLMMEVCNMITGQGITLVKGTQTQLAAAVTAAIASFPITTTGNAPSSGTARVLLHTFDGVAGKIRVYLVYLSSTRMGIEITVNAAWSNGAANWTSDAATYAVRWRFNQPDASNKFPTIDTDYEVVTSIGQTWTESSFSWGQATLTSITGILGTFATEGGFPLGKRMPDGSAILGGTFTPSGATLTAGAQICSTLPAGWQVTSGIRPGILTDIIANVSGSAFVSGSSIYSTLALNTASRSYHFHIQYAPTA